MSDISVTAARSEGNSVILEGFWKSSFFSGAAHFRFVVADAKIAEWWISEE